MYFSVQCIFKMIHVLLEGAEDQMESVAKKRKDTNFQLSKHGRGEMTKQLFLFFLIDLGKMEVFKLPRPMF